MGQCEHRSQHYPQYPRSRDGVGVLEVFYPERSIFLSEMRLGGNGSNDHAKLKTENEFVKQNRKLVHKCGFRFRGRASEHAEQKNGFSESGPQNLDFMIFGAKSCVCSEARPENVKSHL